MTTWSIVVAGGSGRRFGAPKQFASLGSESVLDRAVRVAASACDGVVVVLPCDTEWSAPEGVVCVEGGVTRADSVRRGLVRVPDEAEVIVVHDAARPLASLELFERVVSAVHAGAAGAVPALAVSDTVKRVRGGVVRETLERSELVIAQTPQAFRADVLVAAHARGEDATDDAALVEAHGGRVVVVPGDPANMKLTWPDDLDAVRNRMAEG